MHHPKVGNAEPHSSVGSVADLRTGDRWFDPRHGQYSFRELMIVIVTGFIPLLPLSEAKVHVTGNVYRHNPYTHYIGKNTFDFTALVTEHA